MPKDAGRKRGWCYIGSVSSWSYGNRTAVDEYRPESQAAKPDTHQRHKINLYSNPNDGCCILTIEIGSVNPTSVM